MIKDVQKTSIDQKNKAQRNNSYKSREVVRGGFGLGGLSKGAFYPTPMTEIRFGFQTIRGGNRYCDEQSTGWYDCKCVNFLIIIFQAYLIK